MTVQLSSRSIQPKKCFQTALAQKLCITSTTLYSKIQKLQKFRLESCLKKSVVLSVPASTGCFFNSDTFQINIIEPFLEILKSTKVKSTPYSLTFVNTIKN